MQFKLNFKEGKDIVGTFGYEIVTSEVESWGKFDSLEDVKKWIIKYVPDALNDIFNSKYSKPYLHEYLKVKIELGKSLPGFDHEIIGNNYLSYILYYSYDCGDMGENVENISKKRILIKDINNHNEIFEKLSELINYLLKNLDEILEMHKFSIKINKLTSNLLTGDL